MPGYFPLSEEKLCADLKCNWTKGWTKTLDSVTYSLKKSRSVISCITSVSNTGSDVRLKFPLRLSFFAAQHFKLCELSCLSLLLLQSPAPVAAQFCAWKQSFEINSVWPRHPSNEYLKRRYESTGEKEKRMGWGGKHSSVWNVKA